MPGGAWASPHGARRRWARKTAFTAFSIICDEVGCGITPLDRTDRDWRERVGRLCCRLAAEADEVYRVHCGLGVRIK